MATSLLKGATFISDWIFFHYFFPLREIQIFCYLRRGAHLFKGAILIAFLLQGLRLVRSLK